MFMEIERVSAGAPALLAVSVCMSAINVKVNTRTGLVKGEVQKGLRLEPAEVRGEPDRAGILKGYLKSRVGVNRGQY
jgi:hypothetical protein